MNHIDLFSGIGGFAYAAQQVWKKDYKNIFFCDNNKFCQQILKKNFGKESLIYGDIRDVTKERVINDTNNKNLQEVSLLTGGFPCQPFSQAGKRRGTEDNRYLWPEMLRIIKEFKPTWIIAENVCGILSIEDGLVFEQVCLDLERENYEVQTFIIPAVAVNAPHRRNRIWIIGNSKSNGYSKRYSEARRKKRESEEGGLLQFKGANSFTSNTNNEQRGSKSQKQFRRKTWFKIGIDKYFSTRSWKYPWLEVATKLCGVDDGLPAELDEFKLSKAQHRIERLKVLGNAIVPQCIIPIMQAIKNLE